jgi:hypothetical protein
VSLTISWCSTFVGEAPIRQSRIASVPVSPTVLDGPVRRRDQLGGLPHDYYPEAA